MNHFDANRFAGNRILISGGAGFVGSNLVGWLLAGDHEIAIDIVDNFLSSERDNLPQDKRVSLIEGSIGDLDLLDSLQADAYDFVFHLSTYHGNQSSIHNPLADHENNLVTTLRLLERFKRCRALKKFVYSAAGCAVAEKTRGAAKPTREDAPIAVRMDSPYSISKIAGEFYCVFYFEHHQVPTVRARFQNVFGPGEVLGAGRWRGTPATVWRNVTPTFIYRGLKGIALPVEGDGSSSRDFIYVEDVVRGLCACALEGTPGDVYNLGSGQETTILELARQVNRLTENPAPIEFCPGRDWDRSGCRYGDPAKARKELGFATRTPLDEGLAATIRWTRENMSRIEACIEKHRREMAASRRD